MNNNIVILAKVFKSIILIFLISSCTNNNTNISIPIDTIMQGDIVFRRGDGIVSNMVLLNDVDGKYSHVGLIVKCGDSTMVVHAVPGEHDNADDFDRVKIESINSFFAPEVASRGAVMRIPLNEIQQKLVGAYAKEKAQAKVEFDHNYNLDDTTKLYCTELLQLLFSNIGIDLIQNRITHINCPGMTGDYIMPSDIYLNPNLITIFNF